jgi:hypothetical protein
MLVDGGDWWSRRASEGCNGTFTLVYNTSVCTDGYISENADGVVVWCLYMQSIELVPRGYLPKFHSREMSQVSRMSSWRDCLFILLLALLVALFSLLQLDALG